MSLGRVSRFATSLGDKAARRMPHLLRRFYSKIAANLAGEKIVYFAMARHSRSPAVPRIVEDGMPRALPEELATLGYEVTQKLSTLHALASDPHCNGFSPRVTSAGGS